MKHPPLRGLTRGIYLPFQKGQTPRVFLNFMVDRIMAVLRVEMQKSG